MRSRVSIVRGEPFMTPFLRKILGINLVLVLVMYGLLIFGVFMIESAARHLPVSQEILDQFGSAGAYYASKQKSFILVGSIVYFAVAFVDYRWIRWLGIPFYVVSLGLMAATMFEPETGEAINVHQLTLPGGLQFQPAQLGVTAGILLISWLIQDLPRIHRWFGAPFVRIGMIGVISAIPFLLMMKIGDMGSALVWIPVVVVALLVGGIPFRYLTCMALIGVGLLPILNFIVLPAVSERGPERIDLWLRMAQNKEVDILGDAYSPYYVSMAVGRAGWKGLGYNAPKVSGSLFARGFVSKRTAHNDYIFGVVGEELGFRGSLLLLTAFTMLLIQGLFIAFYSRDASGRMLVCLIVGMFFAHIFESIGMCVLLMPVTGIPLPLISYSGTFVVICMFLLGLVQSVWIHRNWKPAPLPKPAET